MTRKAIPLPFLILFLNLALRSCALSLQNVRVAVVGAGPSGCLLAHRLLKEGAKVTLLDSREDPRLAEIEDRAYALGIGIRGRTAIRSCDDELWEAVKARGFECDRFTLYLPFGPIIRLRDTKKGVEGSLLMYQTELCSALLDELERRHSSSKLDLNFENRVVGCDLERGTVKCDRKQIAASFDLIVGCDGVNSAVREAMENSGNEFVANKDELPGDYKVVRVGNPPPNINPASVCLVVPKKGSCTAFVEPTASGTCILFASRNKTDPVFNPTSVDGGAALLAEAFPKLDGVDFVNVATQLMNQPRGRAFSIRCNSYRYKDKAVLVGDAAHATGGVSGQGVNSALVDSSVLADCLIQSPGKIGDAITSYSDSQVPEGKALYDLSFGPKPKGFMKIRYALKGIVDQIFKGRLGIGEKPLQGQLTLTTRPFSEIRRSRDKYYDEPFDPLV